MNNQNGPFIAQPCYKTLAWVWKNVSKNPLLKFMSFLRYIYHFVWRSVRLWNWKPFNLQEISWYCGSLFVLLPQMGLINSEVYFNGQKDIKNNRFFSDKRCKKYFLCVIFSSHVNWYCFRFRKPPVECKSCGEICVFFMDLRNFRACYWNFFVIKPQTVVFIYFI